MAESQTPSETILQEIVHRVVEVANPEKIILFGSAARGEMGPDSDVDLLVIKSTPYRRKLAQMIYKNLLGLTQPVDVVVVTLADLERYASSPALVFESALREGRIIYAS